MTLTLESVSVPTGPDEDEAPDIDSPGYDAEAPYGRTKSGRIRKRPVGGTRVASGSTPARSEKLARQATAVLMQVNGFIIMGAILASMMETAGKLTERTPVFEDQIYNALVLDPAMCEQILKTGVKSGKVMLLIAIVTHAVAVMPTAVVEFKEQRQLAEAA
jgi:hypothetical protein